MKALCFISYCNSQNKIKETFYRWVPVFSPQTVFWVSLRSLYSLLFNFYVLQFPGTFFSFPFFSQQSWRIVPCEYFPFLTKKIEWGTFCKNKKILALVQTFCNNGNTQKAINLKENERLRRLRASFNLPGFSSWQIFFG